MAAIIVGLCLAVSSAEGQVGFRALELPLESGTERLVLTGHLFGDPVADLILLDRDSRRPLLRIYSIRPPDLALRLEARLDPGLQFVDIVRLGARDHLILYRDGRFSAFDPDTHRERQLVDVRSDFDPPPPTGVLHVDVTEDVNRDGREDLVVPADGRFHVLLQDEQGGFDPAVAVGTARHHPRVYGADGYRYRPWREQSKVHQLDFDHDGRTDLAFWNQDHFVVYRQAASGRFETRPHRLPTSIPFDSDEITTLVAPIGVRNRRVDDQPAGILEGRILSEISDIDGDGTEDLVIFSLMGKSLWRLNSSYEVHFGRYTEGELEFDPRVGASIRSRGIPFEIEALRLSDQDSAVSFLTIKPNPLKVVGTIARVLFTRTVSMQLKVFRFEHGGFPSQPQATRRIAIHVPRHDPRGRAPYFPPVLTGDIDGDGRQDLLIGTWQKGLEIYRGEPEPTLFARRPVRVPVAIPYDEEFTWIVDLDRDGRDDLVLHYPFAHHVSLLLAE